MGLSAGYLSSQRRSDRLAFQNGYFTIQGSDLAPLDKQILEDENIWKKISIPKEMVKEAKEYLELFGINSFTTYPDFIELSKFLNKKYNL